MNVPGPTSRFRFRLVHMLLLVTIAAVVTLLVTRRTFEFTEVQIVENRLAVNAQGNLDGTLTWCVAEDSDRWGLAWLVVCEFENYDHGQNATGYRDLLSLQHGDSVTVRSLSRQMFFESENPHTVFLLRYLNVQQENVVRAVRVSADVLEFGVSG